MDAQHDQQSGLEEPVNTDPAVLPSADHKDRVRAFIQAMARQAAREEYLKALRKPSDKTNLSNEINMLYKFGLPRKR